MINRILTIIIISSLSMTTFAKDEPKFTSIDKPQVEASTTKFQSLLDAAENFREKIEEFHGQIMLQTRPLRMGSRRQRYTHINKWKGPAREASRDLDSAIRKFQFDLKTALTDDEPEMLDPALLQIHFNNMAKHLKVMMRMMTREQLQYELNVVLDDSRKLYRELESEVAKYQEQFKSADGLDNILNVREKKVHFRSANQVCHTVSTPGDIILRKALMYDGKTDNDFGPSTMRYINFLESLKGGDDILEYRHAELITNLLHYNNIESTSYYPWIFNIGKPEESREKMWKIITNKYLKYSDYRTKYSAFRVKAFTHWGETKRREIALARAAIKETYSRLGTCADFVNWAHLHVITSNWNRIPILKHAIQLAYLPEGIQTPDNLANSYMTEKICEVEHSKLIHPKRIVVKSFLKRLKRNKSSMSKRIKEHAQGVLEFLKEKGVIDENGKRLVDVINVSTESENNSDSALFRDNYVEVDPNSNEEDSDIPTLELDEDEDEIPILELDDDEDDY